MAGYAERMSGGDVPACLAVAVLDICRPAIASPGAAEPDLAHWGLAHFLLDGHHKMQAASQAGRPFRLLTLLAIDHSLAPREDVLTVPAILASERSHSFRHDGGPDPDEIAAAASHAAVFKIRTAPPSAR